MKKKMVINAWASRGWNSHPCKKCGMPEGMDIHEGIISRVRPGIYKNEWRAGWEFEDTNDHFGAERSISAGSILWPIIKNIKPKDRIKIKITVEYEE